MDNPRPGTPDTPGAPGPLRAVDPDRLAAFSRLLRAARAVIFDFDGVLVDSERFHFEAYRNVFARHGHTVDETEYYRYWTSLGHGPRGEIERHGLDLDPAEIRREKRPLFSRLCRDGAVRFFPEARELVGRLDAAGKVLTIASGTVRSDIEAVLRNERLTGRFREIIGSDTVSNAKPAPDIILKMLDVLGRSGPECLVIEDAEKGMEAAIAAAVPVVVVRTRETRSFDFGRAGFVCDSHAELIALYRAGFPGDKTVPGEG